MEENSEFCITGLEPIKPIPFLICPEKDRETTEALGVILHKLSEVIDKFNMLNKTVTDRMIKGK